jgi:hypothetical protein
MTGPTNLKPRFLSALDMSSKSGVFVVAAEAVFRHREIHGQVFKATVIVVVFPGPLSAENMVLVTFGDGCRMKVGLGLAKKHFEKSLSARLGGVAQSGRSASFTMGTTPSSNTAQRQGVELRIEGQK